jgi:N-glycosylase/DNA lyase
MKTPAEPDGISLASRGFDLDATLSSGQAFCWRRGADENWRGWIGDRPCVAGLDGGRLFVHGGGLTESGVERYFGLDVSMEKIFASFPANDPWLARARLFAPGLRILRQEPWETLCNFICSSLKQIVQIAQINHDLRVAFGPKLRPGEHVFPSAAQLARVSEAELRACRLGFRARHLFVAARQIAAGEISLDHVATLPTPAAREELMRVRGVGEKVANCVLLFAYGRLEAFPIDVWVERVLRRLYFRRGSRVKPGTLRLFSERHFGPNGGYAQQFLFHWIRNDPTALEDAG